MSGPCFHLWERAAFGCSHQQQGDDIFERERLSGGLCAPAWPLAAC